MRFVVPVLSLRLGQCSETSDEANFG